MLSGNDYLKELKKRARESRVYRKYQLDGLEIAQILHDEKHKSLYIKLAKENDAQKLRRIAKTIAENKNIRNKGAYFMWQLKSWKQQFTHAPVPLSGTVRGSAPRNTVKKEAVAVRPRSFTSKNRNPNKRNNQAK